ncbi:MAG: family 1 extracellular solute-binding protein [Paenibacillaceae bacterium]|nr:family 1 extracellular solute-binding protein [Paenibacillaceae bacterium]
MYVLCQGKRSEPVTITSTVDGISVDDDWINLIKSELAKKHPNITFEFIPSVKGNTLADMVVAGTIPDLIFTHDGKIAPDEPLGFLEDITPMVKKYNVDLNKFNPKYLEDVKAGATNKTLYALPLDSKYHAMYYNKDIFDKFGAPYPTDGMSMDAVVELTKKVSRVEGGVEYRGLNTGSNIIWIAQAKNLFTVDHDKPIVNTEAWKKMFDFGKMIYTIPGNSWSSRTPKKQFYEDKTLAMFLFQNLFDELADATKDGLNWDVVQYPSFPDFPNTYPSTSTDIMLISKTSKNKDAAMQVIQVAISDEVQMARSKQGIVSVLKDPAIQKAFATDLKFLEGKNIQGIFKSHPAASPPISEYRQTAEGLVRRSFEDYLNNKGDVNTILRQAEENITKAIQESKSK